MTPHVCICICTFRRANLLRRLLAHIANIKSQTGAFTYSCVVVDNDILYSARPVAEEFVNSGSLSLIYDLEPRRNFATIRNHAISLSSGDYVAFIDDDEYPSPEWLENMLLTQRKYACDGVLGPVRPYFDSPPPQWILRGHLCDRPVHQTGLKLVSSQCRTGNVLLRRSLFNIDNLKFNEAFATGGEDVDFFKRAIQTSKVFVWCEEAPCYELVPKERCTKRYFLKRALLLGRVSIKHKATQLTINKRILIGIHSLAAVIIYTLAIPILMFAGFHMVMRYMIKICHHTSRLAAAFGIMLMPERNF